MEGAAAFSISTAVSEVFSVMGTFWTGVTENKWLTFALGCSAVGMIARAFWATRYYITNNSTFLEMS